MKTSIKLRAALVGALTIGLVAGGAASAFAAPGDPLNPQSNGSKGSFFLWDANTDAFADGDTSRVYTRNEGLVASASATDLIAEINPAATRPVTGATPFTGVYRFISAKTPADVNGGTNTWKAYSVDSAAGPNGGTLLPSFTLNSFSGIDTLIGTGGSFWYGVAYTTNNGVTVSGAVYREINITAGSGNYTIGAVEVETAGAVDAPTTTTLSATPTSVEAGQTTTLTAAVEAGGKTVTGNVEFYEGANKIGTVALAAGSASKVVTVGTTGAHTYSAKFVENTVGGDKFLASTSADITVTGIAPSVPVPPNAATEDALNANSANGATATYDEATHTATLHVDAANESKTVNMFAYSTPTYLGQQVVSGGVVTANVSTLAQGDHKLAIADPSTGDVLAWASFTKTDAAIDPSFSKTINADVAALAPSDGEFSLINTSGSSVNLTNPVIINGQSVVSGELGTFKVTDMRQVSKPGWSLSTAVADFTKGTDTISASALGMAPKVVAQAGSGATAPTLGSAQVSGSASYPWNFATLAGGSYSGVSTYDADLVFTAPSGKPAGTYSSTITLTLVSN